MMEIRLEEEKEEEKNESSRNDNNVSAFLASMKEEMIRAVDLFNALLRKFDQWDWNNDVAILPDRTYASRGSLNVSCEVAFSLLSELNEEKRKLWDSWITIEKGTEDYSDAKLKYIGLSMNRGAYTSHGVLGIRPGKITYVKHPAREKHEGPNELPFAAFHIYLKPLTNETCFFVAIFRFDYKGWMPYWMFDRFYAYQFKEYFRQIEKRVKELK